MPKLIQHNISNTPTNTDNSFLFQIKKCIYACDKPLGENDDSCTTETFWSVISYAQSVNNL